MICFFRPLPLLINRIYFWYSLFTLICRTLFVLYSAACIYDESRKPIGYVRGVPAAGWTLEVILLQNNTSYINAHLRIIKFLQVRRFTSAVSNEIVALSGKKFFFLTRKLILGVNTSEYSEEICRNYINSNNIRWLVRL